MLNGKRRRIYEVSKILGRWGKGCSYRLLVLVERGSKGFRDAKNGDEFEEGYKEICRQTRMAIHVLSS